MVSSGARCLVAAAGFTAVLAAAPAGAQATSMPARRPAQIFADTCAACHRSPRELKRASAGFLRQHYTTGARRGLRDGRLSGAACRRDPRAEPQRHRATRHDPDTPRREQNAAGQVRKPSRRARKHGLRRQPQPAQPGQRRKARRRASASSKPAAEEPTPAAAVHACRTAGRRIARDVGRRRPAVLRAVRGISSGALLVFGRRLPRFARAHAALRPPPARRKPRPPRALRLGLLLVSRRRDVLAAGDARRPRPRCGRP